jgi:hypothetical protein
MASSENDQVVGKVRRSPGQDDTLFDVFEVDNPSPSFPVDLHTNSRSVEVDNTGSSSACRRAPSFAGADSHDVVLSQSREEMAHVLQVREILREANDVLMEGRYAFAHIPEAAKVADGHLHVAQGDEHGLDDGGLRGQFQPLLVRSAFVQTEQGIPVVRVRKRRDASEERIIGNLG